MAPKSTASKIKKVSCIVPAYNEEKRVGKILSILKKSKHVGEIIFIDDASTDKTYNIAKRFKGIKIIKHAQNRGKTESVLEGVRRAKYPFIMLIDADLVGLKERDIENLARPIISGEADMSISLRKNSLWIFKKIGIDFISGERVFHKNIFGDFKEFESLPKFGLESLLNKKVIENGLKIKIVGFENVSHARKSEKQGFISGNLGDIKMFFNILGVLGLRGIIGQNLKLKKLRVQNGI